LKTIRDLWLTVTGRRAASEPVQPEVLVHDPGSLAPRDLDDPFHDAGVQSRMAGVIAENAAKDLPSRKH
jgi:hypothetical protein